MLDGRAQPNLNMVPLSLEVWWIDLDGASEDVSLLSSAERERAARLANRLDRIRRLKAYCCRRRILGKRLNVHPQDLKFETRAAGKPYLAAPHGDLQFNLSHSGSHGLMAVVGNRSVGADIEVERSIELGEATSQIATPQEALALNCLPSEQAGPAFFDLWTRKEAVLKGLGDGFLTDPRQVDVGVQRSRRYLSFQGRLWTVASLPVGPRIKAAVAVEGICKSSLVVQRVT